MKEDRDDIIDFVKYALHESILPHHFLPRDVEWRANRVASAAQRILNKYGIPQDEPNRYTLLHREEYYNERKQKPYTWLQRKLLRLFFNN
jgi:hypothetical protein